MTTKRHVVATSLRYIGKEADRLEERVNQALDDDVDIVYAPSSGDQAATSGKLRHMAQAIKITAIARRTGLSTKHVSNLIKGNENGSAASRSRIASALRALRRS